MNNPHMAYLAAAAWANGGHLYGANLFRANLSRADLIDASLSRANLRGADLRRANLIGASLIDADLSGASLSDANLSDAKYQDDTLAARIAAADRMDGHTFHLFRLTDGSHKIMAGCRWLTIPEYRSHVAKEYSGTVRARETLDILEFFERRAGA